MDLEIQIALLGILGTLGGTVLGWVLNNFSRHGKLKVFVLSWKDEFEYNKNGSIVPSTSISQTEYYSYNLVLDLYNSSDETKIMRDIVVVFMNGNKELYSSIPYDESTRRTGVCGTIYDDINPINIPPKSVIHIELTKGMNDSDESFKYIWETTHVFLKYKNEKNIKKGILIKKECYKDYFNNHLIQES